MSDITAKIIKKKILIFSRRCSFLSSTSLLQCQVNDRTVVHVVISQGVGILDKNTLKKRKAKNITQTAYKNG